MSTGNKLNQIDESQQMLHQLRNILVSDLQQPLKSTRTDSDTITDNQAKQYLTEAYKLITKNDQIDKNDPSIIYSKICQASQLLDHQNSMIKNYVKDKIQEGVFKARDLSGSREQYDRLLKMRDSLQKKRLQQKIQQNQKINSMIESTRKFKRYQSRSQVPLLQLESLIHKQQSDFDIIMKAQHKIKSQNNRIADKQGLQFEPDLRKLKKKKPSKNLLEQEQNYIIQVAGLEEDQSHYVKSQAQTHEGQVNGVLLKNKNFVKAFAGIIEQHYNKLLSQQIFSSPQSNNDLQPAKKRHKFGSNFTKSSLLPRSSSPAPVAAAATPILASMSELSHMHKFKPFSNFPFLQKSQWQQNIKTQPIRLLISKRIGDSNKFHNKLCIVQRNMLYYSDQPQNVQEQSKMKKKDMKNIQIALTPLEIIQVNKEEGNVFQKKQMVVQTVSLKGVNRNFMYQLKLNEGQKLTQQINKVNLRRLHKISCMTAGQNNKNMQKFIEQQHPTLDFSQNYFRQDREYPQQSYRSMFITTTVNLFKNRKSTNVINFANCKLTKTQLKTVLTECEKFFTNITMLNFSNVKLDKQTLSNVLVLVKKCPVSSTMQVNISNCGIDDSVIEANISHFSSACSKINNLDLSGNQISSNSLKLLRPVFSSKVCEIKTLNLNKCPLEQFIELVNLIKTSNKLETVLANECKLNLNNEKLFEDLLVSTQQKQQLKKLQLKRNICTGSIRWFEEISPFLEINIDLPIKSNVNKALQSKLLRVAFIVK